MATYKKFEFNNEINSEHIDFFNKNGFLHFKKVFSNEVVKEIHDSIDAAQEKLVKEKVEKVNGVPILYGKDETGKVVAQRIPFTQNYSKVLNDITTSDIAKELLKLIPGSRIGTSERDGVVVNHYINSSESSSKKLGWHTDSLRDIFYFEKIRPMLNVGIQISAATPETGCLSLIPGTHTQNIFGTLFRKSYFRHCEYDKNEVSVSTDPGDLTIHDGRLWHCARLPKNKTNTRRSIYFPILCGPKRVKSQESKTPFYLRFRKSVKVNQ